MNSASAKRFAVTDTSRVTNSCARKSRNTIIAIAESTLRTDEIFVSDGSKCDCGFILDILGDQNRIAITDPVYPVYVDTNVMAGHTGAGEARRALRRDHLSAVQCRKRLRPAAAKGTCRSRLSLLPEQSDRRGGFAGAADALGRIRARARRDHPLRCRLRGIHQRSGDSAFDLRNSRRARMRDRVSQFLEERRFHRGALRVHRHAENVCTREPRTGANSRCIRSGIGAGAQKRMA